MDTTGLDIAGLALAGLLALGDAAPASAGESCRPNVLGGEDCRSGDGTLIWSSRPNALGDRDCDCD